MKTIFIDPQAHGRIEEYIRKYSDYFVECFSDTGLWCEIEIHEGFYRTAEQIKKDIYDTIRQKCGGDILPFAPGVYEESRSTTLRVGRRYIALEYEEYSDRRIITDIRIWYKH